jgi:hypothetical protein
MLRIASTTRAFLDMGHWVLNLVQLEINIQSLVVRGFDKKHFLAKPVEPIDYRKLFNSKTQNAFTKEVDFLRCCIEYPRYLFTVHQGGSKDYFSYAQDAHDWHSRLYPENSQIIYQQRKADHVC